MGITGQLKPSFDFPIGVPPPISDTPCMSVPTLYIKPGCPWCDEVVDYLEKKKIPYNAQVVSGNPEAMKEMVALSGQTKAPTMDWDGEVLADFGVDELIPFLKERNVI